MNLNRIKKRYLIPLVLEHHPIQFETMISGPDHHILLPPREESSSPAKERQPDHPYRNSPSTDRKHSSDSNNKDQPAHKSSFPASSETIPVNLHTSLKKKESPLSVTEHENALEGPSLLGEQGQSAIEKNSLPLPIHAINEQTATKVMGIRASSIEEFNEHPHLLPHSGTLWYSLGIEGLILTGLSGLTLFAVRHRRRRSERKHI